MVTRTTQGRDWIMSDNETTTATRTVTYHMTVDTATWAETYGLEPAQVPGNVAEWLDNATHSLGLPSDAVGDIVAVPARREHVELSNNELRAFLRELVRDPNSVHTLRFEFRRDGMAVKVNGGMWSPTVGHIVAAD